MVKEMQTEDEFDIYESKMYEDFKKRLYKRKLKYNIDNSTAIYFVVDDVLYGYDMMKISKDLMLPIIWNELRNFEVDNEGRIHLIGEDVQYFLLEYEDVVELYTLL